MNEKCTLIPLDTLTSYLVPPETAEEAEGFSPFDSHALKEAGLDGEVFFPSLALSLRLRLDEEEAELCGTADGVLAENGVYTLVQTCTLPRHIDLTPTLRARLLLRAQFLALALANKKSAARVSIRLCAFAEGRIEEEQLCFEKETLSRILSTHAATVASLLPLFRKETPRIRFPYGHLREGQKELIHAAWDAIKNHTRLYACAPTGIGKTLATLYPALRALETGRAERVCYASPKNTLKLQAAAAVEALQEERCLRTLVLSAKMSLCPRRSEECERAGCPYFDGFYEKLPRALAALAAFPCITEKELRAIAEQEQICPFELALHMQDYCQVIIGDYNHMLDPAHGVICKKSGSILLVDEAHNLPRRIRALFTESIAPEDFDLFFRTEEPAPAMLREHLAPLLSHFARIRKEREEAKEHFTSQMPSDVAEAVEKLLPKFAFLLHEGFGPLSEKTLPCVRELYGRLKKFASLAKAYDGDCATLYPGEGGVKLYLVDPRARTESLLAPWQSVVLFSATLLPENYYFDLLAGRSEDRFLVLKSPFPRDNLMVGLVPVDVSYSARFDTAPKICSLIHSTVSQKEGNYMVFLPSFEYLRLVSQEYKRRYFHDRILIQEGSMSAKSRRAFLDSFRENKKGTLIGFCVMGGIFSEGVDLKGEALVGEIIVGMGFPPPSAEAEAESAAYYKREMDGKSFAYTLPGWSRVLQAAGRVIRSEEDRGVLILCDLRYLGEDVKELFPEAWEDALLIERDADLKRSLEQFWK
ncbi:MAG: ATP-dependent DNA helicase [Clostridia bacterium]|nr:ATP-dependent DNA helicase [Clostridia bacterium]